MNELAEQIAIVGMAGRFPGANDVAAFWENLKEGVESIRPFTAEELRAAGVTDETLNHPDFVNAGAVMDDPDKFDAGFFGMSPREAEITDPQHRVFLECAWEALEHAGYDPENFDGLISVFGGVAPNTYYQKNLTTHEELLETLGNYPVMIGNEPAYAVTRVAFKLNFKGPSFSVNTACSTSGVALHLACQSLLSGECDLALAGGARIRVPSTGYFYQQNGILSPDGKCRAFDADARGTVVGSGAALLALKRLSDAIEDGDTVHAVVKATAINNDGAHKVGFTAPSVGGQAAVIAEAHALAGITADTVGYVEAHGTATSLGDPIEVAALTKAFRETTDERGTCALGSVKTNIGHLDAGAGAAGIIKTVLALKHGVIPPSLNFTKPNPQIDFANSPFYVNDTLSEWASNGTPRRAGVSTFGLGGTNAHVVLEEAPEPEPTSSSRPYQLLLLSARSEEALEQATTNLADHLAANPDQALAEVAYTLQVGRRGFDRRRIVVAGDTDDAVSALRELHPRRVLTQEQPEGERNVAFMFPGGGAQHVNMALDIYQHEPLFRHWVDTCAETLQPLLGLDLRTLLFPEAGQEDEAQARLEQPSLALPTLLTVEYALAQLWMSWGIQPAAVVGHSAGEYAAACLAGVISLDDALAIITKRGQLFETLPDGSMLSVPLSVTEVEPFMSPDLSIAAVNRPDMCVVSGPRHSIDALFLTLEENEIDANKLHISVAAHSDLVEPILEEFETFLQTISFSPPTLPFVSNVTGTWADPDEVQTPSYWVKHLRQTVRFSDGLETLCQRPDLALLEVGPGQALSAFARHHPARDAAQAAVPSSRHPRESVPDLAFILMSLGRLWQAGVPIDWQGFYSEERRQRIPLPSYPFERQRYWLEPAAPVTTTSPQNPHAVPVMADAVTIQPTSQPVAQPVVQPVAQPATQVANPPITEERSSHAAVPSQPAQSQPVQSQPVMALSRKERIVQELKSIIVDLSGLDPAGMDVHASFLELGLDSLLLTQASTVVKKTFKVRVSFRQLFEDAPTISALAEFIDGKLAPDAFMPEPQPELQPQPQPAPAAPQVSAAQPNVQPGVHPNAQPTAAQAAPTQGASVQAPAEAGALERIMSSQLQIMAEQLNVLRGGAVASEPAALTQTTPVATAPTAQPAAQPTAQTRNGECARTLCVKPAEKPKGAAAGTAIGPVGDVKRATGEEMTAAQRAYLDSFIDRYNRSTKQSKQLTTKNRPHLADAVTVYGFSPLWKELTYLIHLNRSAGSKVWDIDGNEYVDLTMGFGSNLLGHAPDFVTRAVQEQLEKGVELCGISPLAGEVASLVSDLTGLERVAFANSGSEAVLGALRLARTAKGKDKIVTFTGAYHGRYDAVLVGSLNVRGERRSMPQVPGVTNAVAEDTIVLTYDDPNAFETIREHADDIAAVIVEPVQSRNPDIQPREFLHTLRALTEELDIALIFDEVITGFRAHLGGAQAYFGVQADIASYGKAMGGGMPIAVVAGKPEYMDAFDGGMWRYGDDSFPEAGVTFLGGTFIRHPVALASSHASLSYLKEQGPALQIELNERTAQFADELNAHFEATGVPIHLNQFSSWFVFKFLGDQPYSGLLFALLRDKGVHVYESSRCFLSTAHSDEDLAFMSRALKEAAAEMQAEGFLFATETGPGGGSQGGEPQTGTPERDLVTVLADGSRQMPLTEAQREVWLATIFGDDASMAYNISFSLDFKGKLRHDLLAQAVQQVVQRHEALRTTVSPEGDYQRIANKLTVAVPLHDLSDLGEGAQQAELEAVVEKHTASPFDFVNGPLLRFDLLKLAEEHFVLVSSAHHIVCDGWSIGVVLEEIGALYSASLQDEKTTLGTPMQFREYVAWQRSPEAVEEMAEAESYWLEQFKEPPPLLQLPTDRPRPPLKTYDAQRAQLEVSPDFYRDLKHFSKANGFTLFNVLLTGCEILLYRLSGQGDLTVGMTSAGQTMVDGDHLVGHCVNMLPIRTQLHGAQSVPKTALKRSGGQCWTLLSIAVSPTAPYSAS